MAVATLVLEYLKALLSPQCIAGVVALVFFSQFQDSIRALMRRVASIKLPGGAELSAPQLDRTADEKAADKDLPTPPSETAPTIPEGIHLTPEQTIAVVEIFQAERAKAHLWEYRYLNYFLVPSTQRVLDWLAGLKERTTYGMYDAWWLPIIPSAGERRAIIDALQAHYLIILGDGELIEVTPKGRDYIEWRGALPSAAS